MTYLQELMALLEKATPDWRLQKYGVVVGGPFLEYQRGNAQSQLASFMAMYRASAEECDQEANAAAAVAAVNFLRSPAFAEMAAVYEAWEAAPIVEINEQISYPDHGRIPMSWDEPCFAKKRARIIMLDAIDAAASGGGL